ncbi:MAG: CBS domain-containing protein, partial [Chloroflexota bacterium]
LDVETPLEEAADVLLASGYSRVPVFKGQSDNIMGLIYTKDMLKVWRSDETITSLRKLIREANFIPDTKNVNDLLNEMQAERIHIAIVVDEYGGVEGLVTLEDIVEEIFGEIQDEYDEGEEAPYKKISDSEYVFHGRVFLDEVDEIMQTNLAAKDADTLSGLIYARYGGVPSEGEMIQENGLSLTVEQISGRRIRKVRVKQVQS